MLRESGAVAVLDEVLILQIDPREDPRAEAALRTYLAEVLHVCGINGVPQDEAVADTGEYVAPTGAFLLALVAGGDASENAVDDRGERAPAVGCAALRTLGPGVGEVKRMWVSPQLRGSGLGSRLLRELEQRAALLGLTTLRLDTNGALAAAVALYERHGYVPIGRYNENPDATHFFAKRLGPL